MKNNILHSKYIIPFFILNNNGYTKMIQICSKHKIWFVFIALFIFLNLNTYAQTNSKNQKQFEKVRQYYLSNQIERAVKEAEKMVEKSPDYVNASLLLADIYNDLDSTGLEIKYLEIASQYSENPIILYRLGVANYSIGNYRKSSTNFEKYLHTKPVSEMRKAEVLQKIYSCEFAIDAMQNPVDFQPHRLSENINSIHDEYWPNLSLDQQKLVFTRLIRNRGQVPQEDFFIAEFDSLGWGMAESIVEINTSQNEGAQTLSADGRLLFFTACNRKNGVGSCDIYYSKFEQGKWSIPQNAGRPVNSKSWESQPSFSADNGYLYFSSNRAGGKGKKDIWRAKFQGLNEKGQPKFNNPENLGDIINSVGDEISPFIHPNNKSFYFASDFHIGMGGVDLFLSEIQLDGTFSEPKNLGFPINTLKDEQGLTISPDGETAYFASAREANFGLDIYSFQIGEEMRPDPVSYVKAKVVNAETNQPVLAKVDLINLSNLSQYRYSETTDEFGEVLLCLPLQANYAFNVSEKGYLFYSKSFMLADTKTLKNPYRIEIKLEPVKIGAEMNLYNIYFETDSFRILPQSVPELKKLTSFLKNNSDLEVEIQGHTDNSGNTERNQQLSELRAKSVVEYLVANGIATKRLKFKGYGEHQPVTGNYTEEGRMLNRRTTVKIGGI
jgi:flagellar motor protein MotB